MEKATSWRDRRFTEEVYQKVWADVTRAAKKVGALPFDSVRVDANSTGPTFFFTFVRDIGGFTLGDVIQVKQTAKTDKTENGFEHLARYDHRDSDNGHLSFETPPLIPSASLEANEPLTVTRPTAVEVCMPMIRDGSGSVRVTPKESLSPLIQAMLSKAGLSAPPLREWTRSTVEHAEFPWFAEFQDTRVSVDRRSGFGYPIVPTGFEVACNEDLMHTFLGFFPVEDADPPGPRLAEKVDELLPLVTREALSNLRAADHLAKDDGSLFTADARNSNHTLQVDPDIQRFLRAMAQASMTCQFFPHLHWTHFYTHVCRDRLRAEYEFRPKMNHILGPKPFDGANGFMIRVSQALSALRGLFKPEPNAAPYDKETEEAWCKLADAASINAMNRRVSVYTQETLRRQAHFLVLSARRVLRKR